MTLLHRIDPQKNQARFYLVEAGPSLFDAYAVVRLWGRIGGAQRGMITPCVSAEEMEKLAERLVQKKIKRGYKPVESETDTCCSEAAAGSVMVPPTVT